MGLTFSLADCALMPYLIRVDHLNQKSEFTSRANLNRWYEAIQNRPSFNEAVTKWVPVEVISMLNQAGEAVQTDIDTALVS